MKILLSFFLLLLVAGNAKAIHADSTRTDLIKLLKERKDLFSLYSESLNKKSGFFGNKTKNDLRDTQDKLLAVVAADNKIMNSLSRTLDFRNFEKINMSYDFNSFEERLRNLSVLNDTLNKQYLNCKQENKNLQTSNRKFHLYIVFLILLILITTAGWVRKTFF